MKYEIKDIKVKNNFIIVGVESDYIKDEYGEPKTEWWSFTYEQYKTGKWQKIIEQTFIRRGLEQLKKQEDGITDLKALYDKIKQEKQQHLGKKDITDKVLKIKEEKDNLKKEVKNGNNK